MWNKVLSLLLITVLLVIRSILQVIAKKYLIRREPFHTGKAFSSAKQDLWISFIDHIVIIIGSR